MVYQLSEKNQILVALFAIVVLCAGKLFKDYLYRGGYVEGLTSRLVSNQELVRRSTEQNGITLILNVTLGAALSSGGTIAVTWPTGKGITMSATAGHYAITGGSFGSGGLTTGSNTGTVTFSATGQVTIGTTLTITMSNITITAGSTGISDFSFTTTSSAELSTPVRTPVIVMGTGVADSPDYIKEIESAIETINERLKTASGTEATDLRKVQSALVTVLAYTYGTVKQAGSVFSSQELYDAQKTAIDFIKNEKARAQKSAELLSQDNLNKRRMAQINTYYTRNYEANTEVMKNIIFLSVGLIALAVLRKKELIPDSISTLGVIFVLTLGGIVIGQQAYDIIRRNDHDFDKYDWNFNEEEMNKKHITQMSEDPANLSEMGMGMAPCYGPGCCHVGTKWNESAKKCVPSGTASWALVSGANTLTINVYIMNALEATDKITVTFPTGVFNGTPSPVGSLTGPFDVTTGVAKIAGSIHTITITGMGATGTSPVLGSIIKVKTTKEPSESSIMII
jgi:hypothetical protein